MKSAEWTPTPGKPVMDVPWGKVDLFRVTLEEPYRGGGLHFRYGTSKPIKNANYDPDDPENNEPYIPGEPIMYPEDGPAVVGEESAEFILPAYVGLDAFGHFYAPLTVSKGGLMGFTQSSEKSRLAQFWGWYKMPKGDGTMHPPMNRLGPPQIPKVALRPLTRAMRPISVEGAEVVIRPFSFWMFDDPNQYEDPAQFGASEAPTHDLAQLLQGLTRDDIENLKTLLRTMKGEKSA